MSRANEKLAAFAEKVANHPNINQFDNLNSLEAVIQCARNSKAITPSQYAVLSGINWTNQNTDVNFTEFVGSDSRRVTGPEEFYEVPRGAFVAFIELDQSETFPLPGGGRAQKRKLIHSMISLGKGEFVGTNNRTAIAQGTDGRWEILNDLATRFRLRWSKERLNISPVGLPPRNVRVRYRLADDTRDPQISKDIEQLAQHHENAPPGSILRLILGDAIRASDLLPNAQDWEIYNPPPWIVSNVNHGYTAVFYDMATGKPKRYFVKYTAGNTGNLVHELTHVQTNQAYHRDFVNYKTKGKRIPIPRYSADGLRMNEQHRQRAWGDDLANQQRTRMLDILVDLAANISFKSAPANAAFAAKLTELQRKFMYSRQNPHLEYDTVLNQILIWMHIEWKLAQAPEAKAFMDSLEKACTEARDQREEALKEQATAGR
jgi:hypothetical protein